MTNHIHFKCLQQFHEAFGLPKPEHPLISVAFKGRMANGETACCQQNLSYSSDFYSIAIKDIVAGDVHYGRTKYDFSNGSMMFTAPNQVLRFEGTVITKNAVVLFLHPDFMRNHPLGKAIKKYNFFDYATNEALHLSPQEEGTMRTLMQNIHQEYINNKDEFSRDLILANIETLLKYANRYYKRQFLHRTEVITSTFERFEEAMDAYFEKGLLLSEGAPKIEKIADHMGVSPRYLSDSLKTETGKSALDHIHLYLINEAKNLLLQPDMSVSEVAYKLGFDYPTYFSRLFKKKTGHSPKSYQQNHTMQ